MPREPYNDAMVRSFKQGNKTTHAAVSVTTAATQILAANSERKSAIIYNNSAATIFVGPDNTVTTVNGLPVPAAQSLTDPDTIDAWFGIVVGPGASDVRVIEVS